MRAKAEAYAPEDEGDLKASLVISQKRTRRVRKEQEPRSGIQIAMGPASGKGVLNYAGFVEFGTIDTPAQSFMRRAWDTEAQGALRIIEMDLGTEIMKAAARHARKRARTG